MDLKEIKETFDNLIKIGWIDSISKEGKFKLNPSARHKTSDGDYICRKELEFIFENAFKHIGDYMLKEFSNSFYCGAFVGEKDCEGSL
jgi:hypothetical protein